MIIGGAVGRTDLPDSSQADLEASVRRVMQLPPATRLRSTNPDRRRASSGVSRMSRTIAAP